MSSRFSFIGTRILVSLLLAMSLFLFSCDKREKHDALFRQVERVVDVRPDSASLLLGRIVAPERLDSAEWARWALLKIRSRDKSSIIRFTSYSMIHRVVDYYDRYGDNLQRARAYYYMGRIYNELEDKKSAADAYVRAYGYSVKADDQDLLFWILIHWGNLLAQQGATSDALNVFKKASDIALRADDPTNEAIAHLYLGRMYSEVGEWSRSDSSYRKAIDLAEQMDYFDLRVGVQLLAHEYSAPDQLNAALHRIQGMSSAFDLYSAKKMDQEEASRSALIRKGLIIGLIGLMLTAVICGLIYRYRREKERLARVHQELSRLREREEELTLEHGHQKRLRQEVEQWREKYVEERKAKQKLMRAQAKARPEMAIDSFLTMEETIAQLRRKPRALNERERQAIPVYLDAVSHAFITRLREANPALTVGDRLLCGLLRLGFWEELAILLAVEPKTVSKQKQRLREHLSQKPANDTGLIDYIRKF